MYKLLLCVRYLRTRYIALASIISVMLGVATMIVVNSVMAGFTNEMRDRIHGFLADVLIESRSKDGIPDSEALLARVQEEIGDHVVAMTTTVEIPGMLTYSVHGEEVPMPVMIVGVRPAEKNLVSPLKSYLGSYKSTTVNGQVVPAERGADVPLSWELTPATAEYRRRSKDLEEQIMRQQGLLDGGVTGPATPAAADTSISLEDPVFASGEGGDSSADNPFADASDADSSDGMLEEFLSNEPVAAGINKEPLEPRVIIGEQLISYMSTDPETGVRSKRFLIQPGDDVTVTTVKAGQPDLASIKATVVDTFCSGMSEYDQQLVLMNLEELQQARGMLQRDGDGNVVGDAVTTIQIKLKDYSDAEIVVQKLKAIFPPGTATVRTWESKQGLLLSAVEMETAILNVLLFLIITVAGFGILAIFFMIVVEKTRDIGILKSLGASSRGVMSIFLSYGLALGVVGSAAGVGIGLLFVRYINEIENGLSWLTGREVFAEEIYFFSSIPTHVSPLMVLWVALGATAIAVLASVLPARRASRLNPVRALRFD